jgi:hypothetical protein
MENAAKRTINYLIDEDIYVQMKLLAVEKRMNLPKVWEEAARLLLLKEGKIEPEPDQVPADAIAK